MVATFWAAYEIVSLPQIQGLNNLLNHPDVIPKLSLIPDIADTDLFIAVFIITVQWWAVWYQEQNQGGGYVAQRMLSAKDEKNAIWATLLFNFMHYAVRPWPWILIALASIVVFPNLESLQVAFQTQLLEMTCLSSYDFLFTIRVIRLISCIFNCSFYVDYINPSKLGIVISSSRLYRRFFILINLKNIMYLWAEYLLFC